MKLHVMQLSIFHQELIKSWSTGKPMPTVEYKSADERADDRYDTSCAFPLLQAVPDAAPKIEPTESQIKGSEEMERAIALFLQRREATIAQLEAEFGRGRHMYQAIDRLRDGGAIRRSGSCPTRYRAS